MNKVSPCAVTFFCQEHVTGLWSLLAAFLETMRYWPGPQEGKTKVLFVDGGYVSAVCITVCGIQYLCGAESDFIC